jgi:hypothetical protein
LLQSLPLRAALFPVPPKVVRGMANVLLAVVSVKLPPIDVLAELTASI